MNIGKCIHFLRPNKRFNWHIGQRLSHDPDQPGTEKIVEYQDRWTASPSRGKIWLNGEGDHTVYNRIRPVL